MLENIPEMAKSDPGLDSLMNAARDYAAIYLMSKQRQKGCDGMGELATMKEEFGDVLHKMMKYCKDKKYIPDDFAWDVDSVADEMGRL